MEHHYYSMNEAAPPAMGTLNIVSFQEPFDLISPELSGDHSELPSNYHLVGGFDRWMLPMAQHDCSSNNFTTSPTSTATHQTFLSQDGCNPFDISFGGTACSDLHQRLPYNTSSSQIPTYSSCTARTPRIMAKSYSATPTHSAVIVASSRKRRRNSEGITKQTPLGSLTSRCSDTKSSEKSRERGHNPRNLASNDTLTLSMTSSDTPIASEIDNKVRGSSRMLDKEKERHKIVEMKYRKQMKDRFDELLLALPSQSGIDGTSGVVFQKKIRRGKVLDLAKEHIEMLERQKDHLLREQDLLRREVKVYEDSWFGGIAFPGSMG